jgi:hypothetical protein
VSFYNLLLFEDIEKTRRKVVNIDHGRDLGEMKPLTLQRREVGAERGSDLHKVVY